MDASNVFLGAATVFGAGMVFGVKSLLTKSEKPPVAGVTELADTEVPVEVKTDKTVDESLEDLKI